MIEVKKEGVLLAKTNLEFENDSVLNPAAIREGDSVHMYYRAVKEGNYSTLGYCRLDGPLTITERWDTPLMSPEFEYESHGIEDARIVKIDKLYYLTYTAYDGINARGALATSKDLIHFERQGLITPNITYPEFMAMIEPCGDIHEDYSHNHKFYYHNAADEKKILWDKNVVFFPRKIDDRLVFMHRIRPGVQLVSVANLKELTKKFWKEYFRELQDHVVLDPLHEHEASYIGSGCPPIETPQGWLLIYHGVQKSDKGLIYSACAALLNLDDPTTEIARLPYALFSPEHEWELNGVVNNVVFPTGTAVFGETLFIYYGAADSQIACASVNLPDLISELMAHAPEKEREDVEALAK